MKVGGQPMTTTDPPDLKAQLAAVQGELEACRKQLIELHRLSAIGQLLAGVVHEINTPVGSILSNNEVSSRSLQMLRELLDQAAADNKPPPPKAARILEALMSLAAVDKIACERILALVRSLKNFLGGREEEFVRVDLNEVLDNTLKLARCEFRRRIRVETDYGDIPLCECDPQQMGQVFLNLLINAGQAIEGEGQVTLRTRRDGDAIVVAISDTGCGIAPEHRDKIFTSGFTTKPAGVGTGLGLAISKEIVGGLHHGSLTFESEPGHGTTFYVRIPVSRSAKTAS
jgi:two-component system NtrC family sensor kinase